MEFTAQQIAEMAGGRVEGNPGAVVNDFCKIEEGRQGAITFLSNPKYMHYLYETKASVVIINEDLQLEQPVEPTLIRVKNAYECVARLLQLYESMKPKKSGIHPLAFIDPKATVGSDCYIGAFAVISEGAVIGDGCQIYAHTYSIPMSPSTMAARWATASSCTQAVSSAPTVSASPLRPTATTRYRR